MDYSGNDLSKSGPSGNFFASVSNNLLKAFTTSLSDDVSTTASFMNMKRNAFMRDHSRSAYSQYDKNLMHIEPRTEVNRNPGIDEVHRKRIQSAKGKCHSFAGVVPLIPKQERVKNEVNIN